MSEESVRACCVAVNSVAGAYGYSVVRFVNAVVAVLAVRLDRTLTADEVAEVGRLAVQWDGEQE